MELSSPAEKTEANKQFPVAMTFNSVAAYRFSGLALLRSAHAMSLGRVSGSSQLALPPPHCRSCVSEEL